MIKYNSKKITTIIKKRKRELQSVLGAPAGTREMVGARVPDQANTITQDRVPMLSEPSANGGDTCPDGIACRRQQHSAEATLGLWLPFLLRKQFENHVWLACFCTRAMPPQLSNTTNACASQWDGRSWWSIGASYGATLFFRTRTNIGLLCMF
jgi:hypothetical protein